MRKERLPMRGVMEPESLKSERSRAVTLWPEPDSLLQKTPFQLHGDEEEEELSQVDRGLGSSKLSCDLNEIKASLSVEMFPRVAESTPRNMKLENVSRNKIVNPSFGLE